ncbi:unnamed protein product [Sympodiomycopsis kandeliae]
MSSQHSSPEPNEEPRKRQRIQQACKNCGIKRVKCDGRHPCNTCIRTGDSCDYGLPKKRGPPKGSTRSSSKNAALKQSAAPTVAVSSNNFAHHLERPGVAFNQSQSLKGHVSHPMIQPPPGYVTDVRPPLDPSSELSSPYSTSSTSSFAAPAHVRSNSSNSVGSRPQLLPPPQLPRASQSLVDSRHGSYTSLPDIAGYARPKFRGGSSGILDFPSSGLSRSIYNGIPSPGDSGIGSTSPSSFALRKRGDESAIGASNSAAWSARAPASSYGRLPSLNSPRPNGLANGDSPQCNNSAISAPTADGTANSFVNSMEVPRIDREGFALEVVPRCIQLPEIPELTEETVWNLWWQIIAMHWPVLLQDELPLIRDQRRVDVTKQPLLYNAVAALASRIWDEDKDGPIPPMKTSSEGNTMRSPTPTELSDVYFVRARYWLLRNDCESSLETAQALLFMSLRESGCGRSSHSAEYCMSACRTALEMGLHRDFSNRGLSPTETQARLRTWWNIYVLDKTNSAMLGRPCVLRYEESDAPLFEVNGSEEYASWNPSTHDDSLASKVLSGKPVRSLSYFAYGSTLATICEQIVLQYNNVRPKTEPGRISSETAESWDVSVARLHRKLDAFDKSLPEHLQEATDGPTFQHVLCQRMWSCVCRIILHRPYILKQSADPTLPPSHQVCKESAHRLCRLVSTYKLHHGTRKLSSTIVYCVFTAATILLADTTSPDATAAQEAKQYLAECTQHLGSMSGTWTNATVHLNILRHLGKSLEADMSGTGLEMVSEVPAPVTSLSTSSPTTSSTPSFATVGQLPVADTSRSAFRRGVAGDTLKPLNGRSSDSSLQRARSSLSEERFFEISDENYWGQMPLCSENSAAWEMFTSQYLQTLHSASVAADSAI